MKRIVTVLLLIITFFGLQQTADAASVIDKSGSVFGSPKSFEGKIRIDLSGGTIKYLRHAKYTNKSMKTAVQVAQVRGSNITGFAYNCPGYYLTRAYSDSAGTKLVGYIRVQVVASDVTTKGCAPVSESPVTSPPPKNTVNQTHPVPEVEETNNMIGDTGSSGGSGGSTKPPTETEDPYEEPQYLTAAQACAQKNNSGAGDWQIRWKAKNTPTENGHVSGPYCVDMSECMYTDAWYCTAPSEPPNLPGVAEDDDATGVPPRSQYSETSSEEFGSCGIGDTIANKAVTSQCVAGEEGEATRPGGTRSGKP